MATVSANHIEHPRGVQVQGDYLRFLRQSRGWTQMELADRAGYCERLIRKAEKHGYLMPETIEVIAESLSSPERSVPASSLWYSPRGRIDLFSQMLRGQLRIKKSKIASIATDSIVIVSRGSKDVPFAGKFHGHSGLNEWLQRFRFSLADDQTGADVCSSMIDGQKAFLHSCWNFQKESSRSPAIELDIRIDLSMGKIDRMTVVCDTIDFIEFFALERNFADALQGFEEAR